MGGHEAEGAMFVCGLALEGALECAFAALSAVCMLYWLIATYRSSWQHAWLQDERLLTAL